MSAAINFKELKKELKDIEKLSKDHLDIKSWASELKLWIELEGVTDPKKIYIACILTSVGEAREVIQELRNGSEESEEDTEDEDEDDSSSESDTQDGYPSFKKIINALETFYGTKEDQSLLLRELRALRIKRYEKIKDFNLRYKTLYLRLDKRRKKQVSVLDYAESLRGNFEAWKKVSMKDDISLNKAFMIVEKVDRLNIKANPGFYSNNSNQIFPQNFTRKQANRNAMTNSSSSLPNIESKGKQGSPSLDLDIEGITKGMRNLNIKTCYFCNEPGHYKNNCPSLRAIIEKNKESVKL